jgi:hypothetical protein
MTGYYSVGLSFPFSWLGSWQVISTSISKEKKETVRSATANYASLGSLHVFSKHGPTEKYSIFMRHQSIKSKI